MNDKEKFITELLALPSYDMECHNYNGDEMVQQRFWVDADYLLKYGHLSGEWVRSEDVVELLKKFNLI
jgi:hypothetical protein